MENTEQVSVSDSSGITTSTTTTEAPQPTQSDAIDIDDHSNHSHNSESDEGEKSDEGDESDESDEGDEGDESDESDEGDEGDESDSNESSSNDDSDEDESSAHDDSDGSSSSDDNPSNLRGAGDFETAEEFHRYLLHIRSIVQIPLDAPQRYGHWHRNPRVSMMEVLIQVRRTRMLCDFAASADDDSEEGSEEDGRWMPCYTHRRLDRERRSR